MGEDGGTKVCRSDLVRTKKERGTSETKKLVKSLRFQRCFISGKRLAEPISVDQRGNMFNRADAIEFILNKNNNNNNGNNNNNNNNNNSNNSNNDDDNNKDNDNNNDDDKVSIFGLDDMYGPLKMTRHEEDPGMFICPVTRISADGNFPFVASMTCGCFVSKKALREMNGDVNNNVNSNHNSNVNLSNVDNNDASNDDEGDDDSYSNTLCPFCGDIVLSSHESHRYASLLETMYQSSNNNNSNNNNNNNNGNGNNDFTCSEFHGWIAVNPEKSEGVFQERFLREWKAVKKEIRRNKRKSSRRKRGNTDEEGKMKKRKKKRKD